MKYAPIVVFAYSRKGHLEATIEALADNIYAHESDLIIYIDGPRSPNEEFAVNSVREYAKSITGFKSLTVNVRDENWGLSKSITSGLNEIFAAHSKAIILEDDIVTSKYFLDFLNSALDCYENDKNVASIHGYVYPVKNNLPDTFFLKGADCWGWATWSDRWSIYNHSGKQLAEELKSKDLINEFNMNGAYPFYKMLTDQVAGANDSWAIRWHASTFLKNMYTLYPGKSLVQNIGNDSSGTHCQVSNKFDISLATEKINVYPIPIANSIVAQKEFKIFFCGSKANLFLKYKNKLVEYFRK
jgi:hypothetical protein